MMMRAFNSVPIALAMPVNFATGAIAAKSSKIYLDKLDKTLDDWWNELDAVFRSEPGGSEARDLACEQRSAVDKILIKKGCRNVYPATGPNDTSYWICKKAGSR
jgi:hypothetical protein